jgi:hypothetical protein
MKLTRFQEKFPKTTLITLDSPKKSSWRESSVRAHSTDSHVQTCRNFSMLDLPHRVRYPRPLHADSGRNRLQRGTLSLLRVRYRRLRPPNLPRYRTSAMRARGPLVLVPLASWHGERERESAPGGGRRPEERAMAWGRAAESPEFGFG